MMGSRRPSPGARRPAHRKQSAGYATVLIVTVILASGAALLGFRLATAPRPAARTLDVVTLAKAAAATATPSAQPAAVNSTRLVVGSGPRPLLDTRRTGALYANAEVKLPLSGISPDATGVMLEVSMLDARGPGRVVIRTDADDVPALQVAAKHATTSATVVALLGADHALQLRTDGGGQLLVTLVGVFEPAASATAGRIVPVTPEQILRLRPVTGGHDVDLDLADMAALRDADSVSAVLLQVAGDVGVHGGHVYLGPSSRNLNQKVLWGATSGKDRTRHGFVVVPVPKGTFHLQYHAGTELRVDLVGYLTGDQAADSTAGLLVPLTYQAAGAVRVATAGRTNVPLVPEAGLGGVPADQVSAALLGVTAESETSGGITVTSPGRKAGHPILSVAPGLPRSALTLTQVTKGQVTVAGEAGAEVILAPRVLVLGS